MKPRYDRSFPLFLATAIVGGSTMLATNAVRAADGTWNQTGGSTWHTTTNWTSNTIPGAGDTATLGNSITADADVSIGSTNTTVGTLNFDSGFNYSITQTAARTLAFDSAAPNSAQINVTTVNGAGSHQISNTRVEVVDDLTISVASGGSLGINARISGLAARTITKTDDGTLTLTPATATDFTGTFVLNAGTLVAGNDGAFGANTDVELAGGILTNNETGRDISNEINITGTSQVAATQSFTLSGALTGNGTLNLGDTTSGNLNISNDLSGFSGTVNYTNTSGGNNVNFNGELSTTATFTTSFVSAGRYLKFNANSTIGELSGDGNILITNGNTLTVNQSTDSTYSGVFGAHFSGRGAFTKAGTGTLTLTGANQHTEATTVSGGTLSAENNKALGNTTSLTVNGGTLDVRGSVADTLTLGAAADLALSSGTISFDLGTSFDQIVSSGGGAFTIAGGTFELILGDGFDYDDTYAILAGFGGTNSVSESSLSFTGYDDENYLASLGTNGVLSFAAIPEPSSYALLAGFLGLSYVMVRRRK